MTSTSERYVLRRDKDSPGPSISWPWVDGAFLAVLVTVYLFVQLSMLKPPALEGGDQLDYFKSAADLPDVSPSHRHLRLGLLLPVRMAIEIFGYSEAAYYFVPVLSGVLLCASTFLIARVLFNRWVGLAAGLMVVLNPYVLWESSHLLPDVPGAALLTAGILSVTVGSSRFRSGVHDSWPHVLFALGGFLLAWSYMNREYALVLFPLSLVALFVYRVPWRKAGWIVLGALPPLMVELVWGWAVYQNPLIRITTAGGLRGTSGTGPSYATEAGEVLTILGSNFSRFTGGWVFVVLFLVGVVLGTVAVASGNRKLWLPLLWAGGVWAFLTVLGLIPVFLTDGRGTYLRLQKFRYWLPILPGLVILGFASIDWVVRWLARGNRWLSTYGTWFARASGLAMLSLVLVTAYLGVGSIAGNSSYVRNGESHYVELREYLSDEGSSYEVISTDTGVGQALGLVLPMYTRTAFGTPIWDGRIESIGNRTDFVDESEIESGLVVSRPMSYRWLVDNREGFVPPEYLLNPPPSWRPVMISENGDVVVYSIESDASEFVGETAATEWQRASGEGGSDADVRYTVMFDADSGETLEIVDVDGLAVEPGGDHRTPVTSADDAVWGRLDAHTDGSGRLLIYCDFTGEDGSTDSVGASSRDRYNVGIESIDYTCEIPDDGGPFVVDVRVEVRGPMELSIGSNRLYLDP